MEELSVITALVSSTVVPKAISDLALNPWAPFPSCYNVSPNTLHENPSKEIQFY